MDVKVKKTYSGKKVSVHEEFLDQFRADFNKKTQIIAEQEQLIHSFQKEVVPKLEKQIDELKADNFLLKKEIEIKESSSEEVHVNFTQLEENQEDESFTEKPINNVEIISELENKPEIANNFLSENFNPYKIVYLTPLENKIIEELTKEPQTYNNLSSKTGTKPENLRTHKKNLLLKGIVIEDKKINGSNSKILYLNEEQFKRTKIQIKSEL